jgi:hypothetical protein
MAAGQGVPREEQNSSAGHRVVILLDTNPHQKKVIAIEIAVALGIIQKLNQAGNVFSLIAFGSQAATVLKVDDTADNAMVAARDIRLEETKKNSLSVRFYDGLRLALDRFADDGRTQSIVVISEGSDYFPKKTFKQTLSEMQHRQIVCHAAMVASHSFYGTKGIQFYGYNLRRLVGKTNGQYVEVGSNQKIVSRSVDRISDAIVRGRGSSSFIP